MDNLKNNNMNEKEFFIWLDGFVTACNNYQPTPAQWDTLVDTLKKVKENKSSNTLTIPTLPVISTTAGGIGTITYASSNLKKQLND